ncbi:MAG: DegV family protein [Chloroflexia bacterium]
MPTIRVVTDSTCDLPDALVRRYGITVVPVSVLVGGQAYLDRVNLTTDALLRAMQDDGERPTAAAPTTATFEQVYRWLQRERPCDGVVSIHVGAHLSGTYGAARAAGDNFANTSFPVGVFDSESASMGLGIIALAAAREAAGGGGWSAVMQAARRAKGRTHVAFMVDSVGPLYRGGKLPGLSAGIESLLPLKPLLSLDGGQITLLERSRTRHKALDSLCCFVEEFPQLEELAILHSSGTSDVENIAHRLAPLCPRGRVSVVQYGPANAAYLGPGAVGVVVHEGGK